MSELENAADNVRKAMRSLDAHRHDGAPSLEREYRRALEAYFDTAERVLGSLRSGDEDVGDQDLDDLHQARADALRTDVASIDGHYAAARRAIRLARGYQSEVGTSGRRERECVQAVQRHREAIRNLRLQMRPPSVQLQLPGLAKTRPQVSAPDRAAKTG